METHNKTVSAASSDNVVPTGSPDDTDLPGKTATAEPTASPAQPTELTIVPPAWGFQHLGHLEAFLGILCFIAPETIPEELYADLLPNRLCYATDAQQFAFSIRFREAPSDLDYSKLAQSPDDVRQHWDCTIPHDVQEAWLWKIGGEGYQAAFAEAASLFNDLFPPPAVAIAAHYPHWGDGYPEAEPTEEFVSLMANVALWVKPALRFEFLGPGLTARRFLFEAGDRPEEMAQVIDKGLYAYGALGDHVGVHATHAQLQKVAGLDAEGRGFFERALIHFRACYRIHLRLPEKDNVELSEVMYNIAVAYASLDKWSGCLYYCQQSIEACNTLEDGCLKEQMIRKRNIMVARYFIASERLDEAHEILQDCRRYFGRKSGTFPRDASLRKKPVEKNWLMQANVLFALGHHWRARPTSGHNHYFASAAFQYGLGRYFKLTRNRLEARVYQYQMSRDLWLMAMMDIKSGGRNTELNVNCAITQARLTVKGFEEAGDHDSIHRARADFLLAEVLALDQAQDTLEERRRLRGGAMEMLKRLHPESESDLEPSFESLDRFVTLRLR